ncbi:MAG: HEAT repeat domain-containing protein [Gemmatimonadota bacterium]|nr:HEAT repeat domain-containing protein [Gemmatimonadota bacterium]
MLDRTYLFDDDAMRDFIVNGYHVIGVEKPAALHDDIYEKTKAIIDVDGNPGNNLLPRVPEIQQVYDDPSVRGALTSLLGPDYVMHAHRHPHVNPPNSRGGAWHKDSYWGYTKVRDHHPRWIMAMYYPQDTPVEIGPTGVIPGSHYVESREETVGGNGSVPDGFPASGKAGTVTIIHFDLWHRAFPNQTDKVRYMMKFQFTRMSEPDRPWWNRQHDDIDLGDLSDHPRSAMWRNMWHWLAGNGSAGTRREGAEHVEALAGDLTHELEQRRLHAAYTLAECGEAALPHLLEAIQHEQDEVRREACYGLGALGAAAVEPLVPLLGHGNERVRGYAVYALGDIRHHNPSVAEHLAGLTDDSSPFVRQNVADALGQIKLAADASVPALVGMMKDEDEQVRSRSAYALARFGDEAQTAIPHLADACYDENRYVQGQAAIALEQIGTPEALRTLLHWLQASRWCPLTTAKSTY